ncbi:13653_t:CDS:2, partial [Rhizophagus irregularis]
VVDKTINDETLNDKHKRSIASSSDDSKRNNTGPFHLSLSTPTLQKNTLIFTPKSTSFPKLLFSSIQCKNTTKKTLIHYVLMISLKRMMKLIFLASDSRILMKILEVVMQNQKDLKFLSTKVTGLENDNKTFQKELSEIKDAIWSSDKSLKAVSSNKKGHGWIDVYISYITEDYTNIQQKNKLKRLPC